MVETEVIAALTGGSPSLVAGRVYAHVLPDDSAMPAVTYARVSTVSHNHLTGWGGRDLVRMQVDSWAATYDEARRVAAEVRQLMESAGFKGLMANDWDDFEPDTGRYRVSADYMVWQRR
jgi:hypothetical protein